MTLLTTRWLSFVSSGKRPLALLSLVACMALIPAFEVQANGGAWGSHGSTGSLGSSGGSWGSSGGTTVVRRPVRNLLGRICDRISSIGSRSHGSHGSSGGSYGSSGGSSGGRVVRYSSHGSSGSTGYVNYGSSGGSLGSSGGYSSLALSAPQYSGYGTGMVLNQGYQAGSFAIDPNCCLNDLCCNGVLVDGSFSGQLVTPGSGVDAQGRVPDGGSIDSMLENGGSNPGGQYYQPPAMPENTTPNPGPETGNDSTQLPVAPTENRAVLSLSVPSEAKVYINDRLTQTEGDLRSYESANLNQDRDYHYLVKAELERDGKRLVRTQMVTLRPGTQKSVTLDFESPAVTTLALQVPENATVTLCGKVTDLTGSERKFVTSALVDGEQCDGYTIEVAYLRDGEIVKDVKTIDLVAGDLLNLKFGQPADSTTRIASK